jgi:hypothetical protein
VPVWKQHPKRRDTPVASFSGNRTTVIVTVAGIGNKMVFLSLNIEGFQRDGARLFCSNPVINGSQTILADIQAQFSLFTEFLFLPCHDFFKATAPTVIVTAPKTSNATASS